MRDTRAPMIPQMVVLAICLKDCVNKAVLLRCQRLEIGFRDGGLKHLPAGLPLCVAGSFQEVLNCLVWGPMFRNINRRCTVGCDFEGDRHGC